MFFEYPLDVGCLWEFKVELPHLSQNLIDFADDFLASFD
jgi:hypothetical protein